MYSSHNDNSFNNMNTQYRRDILFNHVFCYKLLFCCLKWWLQQIPKQNKRKIFCLNKPQPNLHSGDTFLGPEGVPWIEVLLFCAPVRPKLECSGSMWSPYIMKHRALIENVQRGATKFILNYPSNMSHKERLINWIFYL